MASTDPTPKRDGKGMTCWIEDAANSQVDVETDFGIRAFLKIHCDGLAAPGWIALILSTTTPHTNATYDDMPRGSICILTDGSDILIKDTTPGTNTWGSVDITT